MKRKRRSLQKASRQRNQHQKAQVEDGIPEAQAKTRQDFLVNRSHTRLLKPRTKHRYGIKQAFPFVRGSSVLIRGLNSFRIPMLFLPRLINPVKDAAGG